MPAAVHSALSLGSSPPPFSLPGVDDKTWSLDSFADAAVLVVVFTCNHCPAAKAYEDRLVAIQQDYGPRGVRLVAINPNDHHSHPEDSFENMKVRAAQKKFNFPYLRDEPQTVARAYGAACTPDPFVFDRDRKLVYAGRIDDSTQSPQKASKYDLRRAIDLTLEGRAVDFDVYPAVGCTIKWEAVIAHVPPLELPIDEVRRELDRIRHPFRIVIERAKNPFNVGAIIRTAHSFLAKEIILVGDEPWYERAAMGMHRFEHVVEIPTVAALLERARAESWKLCAFEKDHARAGLWEAELPEDAVMVFGNEDSGVSPEILAAAHQVIAIPMFGINHSYPITVAAGIAMAERARRHYRGGRLVIGSASVPSSG